MKTGVLIIMIKSQIAKFRMRMLLGVFNSLLLHKKAVMYEIEEFTLKGDWRAEHVDDDAVAKTAHNHEKDVEYAEQVVQHRVRFFVLEPMGMDVRFVIGRRVPAIHSWFVPWEQCKATCNNNRVSFNDLLPCLCDGSRSVICWYQVLKHFHRLFPSVCCGLKCEMSVTSIYTRWTRDWEGKLIALSISDWAYVYREALWKDLSAYIQTPHGAYPSASSMKINRITYSSAWRGGHCEGQAIAVWFQFVKKLGLYWRKRTLRRPSSASLR